VPGRVRRGRFSVVTFFTFSGLCLYVFGVVGFVSGRDVRGRLSVGTCSAKSG